MIFSYFLIFILLLFCACKGLAIAQGRTNRNGVRWIFNTPGIHARTAEPNTMTSVFRAYKLRGDSTTGRIQTNRTASHPTVIDLYNIQWVYLENNIWKTRWNNSWTDFDTPVTRHPYRRYVWKTQRLLRPIYWDAFLSFLLFSRNFVIITSPKYWYKSSRRSSHPTTTNRCSRGTLYSIEGVVIAPRRTRTETKGIPGR